MQKKKYFKKKDFLAKKIERFFSFSFYQAVFSCKFTQFKIIEFQN